VVLSNVFLILTDICILLPLYLHHVCSSRPDHQTAGMQPCSGVLWKKLNRLLQPLFQAPVTPSERHQERNQKVPGCPRSWGSLWNLLVSLLMSLGGSNGRLKKWLEQPIQLLPEDSRTTRHLQQLLISISLPF
jgi:hypothetical protein